MLKIDSCLIAKNEMPHIMSLIDQLLKFSNNVYIVDTGSTDGTYEAIEEKSKTEKRLHIEKFEWIDDFSAARNRSFELSKTSDYIFWCDADDVLNDKLMQEIQKFKKLKMSKDLADGYVFGYMYKPGEETSILSHFRFVKRKKEIKWVGKIHEVLMNIGTMDDKFFSRDALLIHEHTKHNNPTEEYLNRNINIFRKMEKNESHIDIRDIFYYANELFFKENYLLAHKMYEEVVYYTTGNEMDKIIAANQCSIIESGPCKNYNFIHKYNEMMQFLYVKGIYRGDMLCHMGDYCYIHNDLYSALKFYNEAIGRGTPLRINDFGYNYTFSFEYPCARIALVYLDLHMLDVSKRYIEEDFKRFPDSKLVQETLAIIKKNEDKILGELNNTNNTNNTKNNNNTSNT